MEKDLSTETRHPGSPHSPEDPTRNLGAGGNNATPPSPLDPHVLAEIRSLDASGTLLRTAFGMFLDDGPRLLQDLRAALDRSDREAFIFAAHTLKSCSGSVGAVRITSACGTLERAAREGEALGPASALELLGQHLREATTEMARECGQPSSPTSKARG